MNTENTDRICSQEMIQWCEDMKICVAAIKNKSIINLLQRFPVNATDDAGNTLLHYVSKSEDDSYEIIKYLLEYGYNINTKNDQNESALIKAMRMSDVKTVEILLNFGATTDHTCYPDNNGPLHLAAMEENNEMIKLLLKAGCNMYVQNKEGKSPFDIIIQKGNVEVAKIFLENGASRDHKFYGKSIGPLHKACLKRNPKMVKLFLDAGYKVSARTEDKNTPLHLVLYGSNKDDNARRIVKLLIKAGANVNKKANYSTTPLHMAVERKHYAIIDILLKAGADINAVESEGNTVLHIVLDVFLARKLIDAGIDIHKINNFGQSCIRVPIESALVELLALYIKHGARIDVVDRNDMDLLCAALLSWGSKQKYDYWEHYNWDFEDEDQFFDWDKNITFCKKDELEDQIKIIEVLCKHGFNINRVMKNGHTLFCVALEAYSHTKIIRALLSNGLLVNFNNLNVRTIMKQSNYNLKHQHILIRHAATCNLYKNGKGIVNFDLKKLSKEQALKYQNCIKELKNLKDFNVYESMSLFNLIEGPVTSRYILNENLIQSFETGVIAKTFPMFNDILIERFENERKKYELMLKATVGLKSIMNFNEYSYYDLVYRTIIQYLGTEDQHNLASLVDTFENIQIN